MRPHEFSKKTKLAAYRRCLVDGKPHCEGCGRKIIGVPEFDHQVPVGLSGESTLENCKVLCGACHRIKTHEQDRPIMHAADRQMKSAAAIKTPRKKIASRGFPKSDRKQALWMRTEETE